MTTDATSPVPSPAAERMRRHRERQRDGLRCLTIELRETEIGALIQKGLLRGTTARTLKQLSPRFMTSSTVPWTHRQHRGAPRMGRGGFDLSIAELGRQRVEISRAAGADHLDGLPPRRTTSLVYLSLWASSCGSLRCWRTVRVSALLRLGL